MIRWILVNTNDADVLTMQTINLLLKLNKILGVGRWDAFEEHDAHLDSKRDVWSSIALPRLREVLQM